MQIINNQTNYLLNEKKPYKKGQTKINNKIKRVLRWHDKNDMIFGWMSTF